MRLRIRFPSAAKDIERIGGHAADAVVGRTHYKLCPRRDGAKLSDYQPVAEARPVKEHIVLFKAGRIVGIVIIGVVAYFNI